METGKLYRLKRGNLTNVVAFILKGVSAAVTIYGSASLPAALANMVDINGGTVAASGMVTFQIAPEYVSFTGTVTGIEIVGCGYEEVGDIA